MLFNNPHCPLLVCMNKRFAALIMMQPEYMWKIGKLKKKIMKENE